MFFEIYPYTGFDKIRFGMTPQEARAAIGGTYISFKRTSFSVVPSDYFEEHGLFFYYDSEQVLEAVEFCSPARPTLLHYDFFAGSFAATVDYLSASDTGLTVSSDGATSLKFGIGIYAPLCKESLAVPVESVIIFGDKYDK